MATGWLSPGIAYLVFIFKQVEVDIKFLKLGTPSFFEELGCTVLFEDEKLLSAKFSNLRSMVPWIFLGKPRRMRLTLMTKITF